MRFDVSTGSSPPDRRTHNDVLFDASSQTLVTFICKVKSFDFMGV